MGLDVAKIEKKKTDYNHAEARGAFLSWKQ